MALIVNSIIYKVLRGKRPIDADILKLEFCHTGSLVRTPVPFQADRDVPANWRGDREKCRER